MKPVWIKRISNNMLEVTVGKFKYATALEIGQSLSIEETYKFSIERREQSEV